MSVRELAHVMSDEESSSSDDDNDDDDDDYETRSSYYPFYNWRAERLLREEFIASEGAQPLENLLESTILNTGVNITSRDIPSTSTHMQPVGSFMNKAKTNSQEYVDSSMKFMKEDQVALSRKKSTCYIFNVHKTSRKSVY